MRLILLLLVNIINLTLLSEHYFSEDYIDNIIKNKVIKQIDSTCEQITSDFSLLSPHPTNSHVGASFSRLHL